MGHSRLREGHLPRGAVRPGHRRDHRADPAEELTHVGAAVLPARRRVLPGRRRRDGVQRRALAPVRRSSSWAWHPTPGCWTPTAAGSAASGRRCARTPSAAGTATSTASPISPTTWVPSARVLVHARHLAHLAPGPGARPAHLYRQRQTGPRRPGNPRPQIRHGNGERHRENHPRQAARPRLPRTNQPSGHPDQKHRQLQRAAPRKLSTPTPEQRRVFDLLGTPVPLRLDAA